MVLQLTCIAFLHDFLPTDLLIASLVLRALAIIARSSLKISIKRNAVKL